MPASDDLIRQLIEARFAGKLSPEEVEALLPYVRRGQATSERLAAFPLEGLDPRLVSYISDKRLAP